MKNTKAYKMPSLETAVLGTFKKGQKVKGKTGKVVIKRPGKLEVLKPHSSYGGKKSYKQGDVIWVYTSLGEGYSKVWFNGEMYAEDIFFFYHGHGAWARCVDEGTCWGKAIQLPESVWWVYVESPSGWSGWSDKPENFSNKDACG